MILKKIAVFLVLMLFIISCKKEVPSVTADNVYKFKDYISEVTSGIIPTKSQIKIVLMNPVNEWSENIELDKSILKITPSVKGKVTVLNNRTLAFIPEKRLKQDTRYRLKLNLGAIQEVSKEYEIFEFDVKTIKQDISITTDYQKSYSKEWQYIEGVVKSSDVLSPKIVENLITATQEDKKLKVKITAAKSGGQYFKFVIDSIRRFEKSSDVEIKWDGTPFEIESKGDYDFEIPGKNDFKVISINVLEGEKKYIEINFSNPLKRIKLLMAQLLLKGNHQSIIILMVIF